MSTLLAVQMKCPEANNSRSRDQLWEQGIQRIDRLQEKYCFGQEIKELFYELLQQGHCFSYDESRILRVSEILECENVPFTAGPRDVNCGNG